MPPFSLNRHPRYFSFPDTFWPERWLIASGNIDFDSKDARVPGKLTKAEFVHNDAAYVSFGLGPTSCVGKALATVEMRMVVALLMQRFDFQFAEGYDPKEWGEQLEDHFAFSNGQLMVKLTPRM